MLVLLTTTFLPKFKLDNTDLQKYFDKLIIKVILGINYNTTADNWSFACMIFEMLTGDFLFEPRKNEHFSKDEDHLA